jgi:Protein of unknown function (DUF4232)
MTMAPPRESHLDTVTEQIELLIREARRRARRRRLTYGLGLVTTVAALMVVAAIGGYGNPIRTHAGGAGVARGAALAVAPCTASSVKVSLEGSNGGMGTFTHLFWVRNVSNFACSMTGYPTVSFISSSGKTVPQVVTHVRSEWGILGLGRGGALPKVDLAAHGGVASFWVADHDVPAGNPPAPCVNIAQVGVSWPNAATGRAVPLGRFHRIMSCGHVAVFPVMSGIYGAQPHQSLRFYFGTRSSNNPNYGSYPTSKST